MNFVISARDKARSDLAAAEQARTKLTEIPPHYRAQATLTASGRKLEQISADYRQRLQAERADNSGKLDKTQAEYAKQQYRHDLLELKASQEWRGKRAPLPRRHPSPQGIVQRTGGLTLDFEREN